MCLALHHLVVTATGVRIRAGQQQRCGCQQDRRHPTTSPEHAARAVCGDRYCRGLREEEKRAEGTWHNCTSESYQLNDLGTKSLCSFVWVNSTFGEERQSNANEPTESAAGGGQQRWQERANTSHKHGRGSAGQLMRTHAACTQEWWRAGMLQMSRVLSSIVCGVPVCLPAAQAWRAVLTCKDRNSGCRLSNLH